MSNNRFKIGNYECDENNLPYIIAEIGVNHNGSLSKAKKLIDLAAKAGANAAKFQTYKAKNLAIKNSPAYWDKKKEKTKTQYLLFKKYDLFNKEDYIKLANYCKKKKIHFLSTPFDISSVRWLKKIVHCFKIASADITNVPLLSAIAKTKKPIILSTGASNIKEIKIAIRILKRNGTKNIALLHCILNYPTLDQNANLKMITSLKKIFSRNIIGYSDHTVPKNNLMSCIIAYIMGARIIEKHFTYNKKLKGNDHYHAMSYLDLKNLNNYLKISQLLIGKEKIKKPIKSEYLSRLYARRSIVAKKNIFKGDILSEKNLITKRPALGLSPLLWEKVIGKKAKNFIKEDEILKTI